jgi:hypothetical protein
MEAANLLSCDWLSCGRCWVYHFNVWRCLKVLRSFKILLQALALEVVSTADFGWFWYINTAGKFSCSEYF